MSLGAAPLGAVPLGGLLSAIAAPPPVASPTGPRVEVTLHGIWTSLKDDLLVDYTFAWKSGTTDPFDHVADTGTCEFSLRNDAGNSGGILGWYSPNHEDVRSGWDYGILVRVVWTDADGIDHVLWTGKLESIVPVPGIYGERRVQCLALDIMNELAENDVRSVSPQLNQTENAILAEIFSALPTAAQPASVDYDSSLDTYPYALWNASSGTKAMSLLVDVMNSSQGYLFPEKNGAIKVENRHARPMRASRFTFDDASLVDIVVPTDLKTVPNHLRVVTHPVTVDATATTVLFGIQGIYKVPAHDSITIWGDFVSPDNSQQLIGGTATVTPVSGTDFAGNSLAAGGGTNLTSSLSVVATAFAASVKFVVSNSSGTDAYLVNASGTPLLQIRGKGIYDNAPASFESGTGERLLTIDMPYQSDGIVAQDRADFLQMQYNNLADQIASLGFVATRDDDLLEHALTAEIGDIITASETVTGVTDVDAAIQGISMQVVSGVALRVTYALMPRVASTSLILDDPMYGVLDSGEAALGYA